MKYWQRSLAWLGLGIGLGWAGFGDRAWVFLCGVLMSWGLLLLDRMIYVWWLYPFEQWSIQVQYWFKQKDWFAVIRLLTKSFPGEFKLVLKKKVMVIVWPLLSIYVLTSLGDILAMGMVMGLGLSLVETAIYTWKNKLMTGVVVGTWALVSMAILW